MRERTEQTAGVGGQGADSATRRGFRHAIRYRRCVALLKFVLPVTAAALVLLVVAWPSLKGYDTGFRLEFSETDYTVDGTVRMTKPRFVGTSDDGRPFTVTAETASREARDERFINLDAPTADLTTSGGEWIAITAHRGVYDQERETVDLDGDVSVYSASGLEFHTEHAVIDLAAGTARGDEPVQGQGPWGLIDATGFRYDRDADRIVFLGRPKLTLF